MITKRSANYNDPKTTTENLVYAAVATANELFDEEHLGGPTFINMSMNFGGLGTKKGELWKELQGSHNIDYDQNIRPKCSASDNKLVAHV